MSVVKKIKCKHGLRDCFVCKSEEQHSTRRMCKHGYDDCLTCAIDDDITSESSEKPKRRYRKRHHRVESCDNNDMNCRFDMKTLCDVIRGEYNREEVAAYLNDGCGPSPVVYNEFPVHVLQSCDENKCHDSGCYDTKCHNRPPCNSCVVEPQSKCNSCVVEPQNKCNCNGRDICDNCCRPVCSNWDGAWRFQGNPDTYMVTAGVISLLDTNPTPASLWTRQLQMAPLTSFPDRDLFSLDFFNENCKLESKFRLIATPIDANNPIGYDGIIVSADSNETPFNNYDYLTVANTGAPVGSDPFFSMSQFPTNNFIPVPPIGTIYNIGTQTNYLFEFGNIVGHIVEIPEKACVSITGNPRYGFANVRVCVRTTCCVENREVSMRDLFSEAELESLTFPIPLETFNLSIKIVYVNQRYFMSYYSFSNRRAVIPSSDSDPPIDFTTSLKLTILRTLMQLNPANNNIYSGLISVMDMIISLYPAEPIGL